MNEELQECEYCRDLVSMNELHCCVICGAEVCSNCTSDSYDLCIECSYEGGLE